MSIFQTVNKNMIPEKYKQMSTEELENRVREIKARLGNRLFIPGHHYQKDEVIQFADATGDSLDLPRYPLKIVKQSILFSVVFILWRKQLIF